MTRLAHRLVPGILAGALLLPGGSGILAASAKAQPRAAFVYGQVSNLSTDGTSFTLTWTPKAAQGATATPTTVQVLVTTATKEKPRKGTTGALVPGDYALVVGTQSQAGLTARRILYSATAFNGRAIIARLAVHRAVGTVSATTAASAAAPATVTIVTKVNKSLTFTITATTKFRVNKTLQSAAPTFTQGERIIVRFRRDAKTKTLVAVAIAIPAAKSSQA